MPKGTECEKERGMIELKGVLLESPDSPRGAFYQLSLLEMGDGTFLISKVSGASGRILNERSWVLETKEEAEKRFAQKIHQKTSPDLKSRRRRYHVAQQLSLFPE